MIPLDVIQSFIDFAAFCSSEQTQNKEMSPRLGWVVSYKSLYFVDRSLELMCLLTGLLKLSRLLTKSCVPQKVARTSESVN